MQNCGTECMSVGRCTLNEGNKRGDWMKHWLMLQGYTGLNTMYRKTPQKLTKRRANDMIHMGRDHRCVMATITITTPGKSSHYKTIKGKNDIIKHEGETKQ